MKKGSEGLKSIGRSLRFGVSRAVFPEDLKVSEKKIFDPQDKILLTLNKLFIISCILAVSVDPLLFYLPVVDLDSNCIDIDKNLAITSTTVRTVIDVFYVIHMFLQFRTAYIAPSSRVFGRGELVIDSAQIAKRYLRRYFIIDFLAVLPLPQIVIWRFLHRSNGSDVLSTKDALLFIVLLQYIPRFLRIIPLNSELKRTAGAFAESAWAGAAYYLLWYILASHIIGAFWYLFAIEREDTCWNSACKSTPSCKTDFLYCGNQHMDGFETWKNNSSVILGNNCSTDSDPPPFDFGIFAQALSSKTVASRQFVSKFCYCLWWGLQNLSTLGQGLQTSTYSGEVIFSIALATLGLVLFALLIGNMQTYLQSLTIRLEEMRVKRRDSEQWMHHRLLPQDLRERVRRYDQYKWLETRGVDEESLVQSLPKDLRRDIKRHLCLALVRRVPLFENMDERLLDAICERLKPSLYTENTYIVREGDPVDEMLFIIRGRLESVTTDAEELKFVASQFRRLHSRQVQHTFRFYSQQWRTWAACFIQAAWRRYSKRKNAEMRHREEEGEDTGLGPVDNSVVGGSTASLGATIYASRFAANALRGVHRLRNMKSARELVTLQKPPEPDFTADDSET
ncbi:putative cyclic nucleotide-gated ion channel 5 [Cinnamomum micranthum f. kanehirae]|uniref:Putative cyclic nucleotide-gated ion channel 5 n=1 Tax=Cinnamomum micranthum f. kanehirae TaxID=337451 RepID=A0A443PDG9_9MAGN|nr:putative cyclic nucleotide-gated ion channel 5 [Cinnamomum micranthum f. kanehirae]